MSWNAFLASADGFVCVPNDCWNYTYNTTPMVVAAAERAGVPFGGFQRTLDGLSGVEGALLLKTLLAELDSDPARYEAMNPPNGWGDYDGIRRVMREMVAAVPVESPTTWVVT